MSEYNGQARPFADSLEFEVERCAELLGRMILALEDYIRDAPPISNAPRSVLPTPTSAPSAVAAAEAETEAEGMEESPDEGGA